MNLFKSLTRSLKRDRTPADLAAWLKVPEAELRGWLDSSPPWTRGYDYTRFSVPKRRSGATRQIEAPGEKLKDLQRRVLRRLLNPLPIHPAATGFVRGRSIVHNARPHTRQGIVINVDLADFFLTITAERVTQVFRSLGWNAEAAAILSRICTNEGRLPQGAPTSPALSNLVCRSLDARLAGLAAHYGGHYTRYADDITLSLPALGRNKRLRPKPKGRPPLARPKPGPSRRVLAFLRSVIEEEGFRIQMKKKVRIQRPHQRQTATGLVVNQTVNLPRAVRRRIRAMQDHERRGRLDEAGRRRLRGLEALLAMVQRQR